MADSKISALTELTAPAVLDELAIVDKSDTSMASSGTTKRLLASRLQQASGFYNAVSYGADPSGSADCRSAIQDAVDACTAAGGGIVYLPPGTYKLSSSPGVKLKEGVKLQGAGMDATVISCGINMAGVSVPGGDCLIGTSGFDVPISLSDNVVGTMSANVAAGDETLTLSSTASLVDEEWYILMSDDRQHPSQTSRRGEFVHIQSVDSGTVVTLRGQARDNYTTANGAKLYSITFVNGVGISDLQIYNPSFDATTTVFIHLDACRDFYVERVLMVNGDGPGVQMASCYQGRVDVIGRNFNDNNPSGRNGYVTSLGGLNENIEINLNVVRCRHAVTSGPFTSYSGQSRGIRVSGLVQEANVAFDQHNAGQNWVFENAHALNCYGYGFHIRSLGTKLIGCTTDQCELGLQLTGTGSLGYAENTTVIGCEFKRTNNRSGTDGFAVNIDASGSSTRARFIGCVFEGSARQLFMAQDGEVRILGCDFVNPGQDAAARALDVGTGATVFVDNCTFWTTATATDDAMSSAAAPGVNAIRLPATGSGGNVITNTNRQVGFTGLVEDLGASNTVEQLTSTWSVTNPTTNRAVNVTGTAANIAQGLGTLITDLKTRGVIP